jgi:hypothetical protein
MIVLCSTRTIAYIERLVQNGCNRNGSNYTVVLRGCDAFNGFLADPSHGRLWSVHLQRVFLSIVRTSVMGMEAWSSSRWFHFRKRHVPRLGHQVPHQECAFSQVQSGSLDRLSGHRCSSLRPSIWIPWTRFGRETINRIGEGLKRRQLGVVVKFNINRTMWSNLPSLLKPEWCH